MKDFEGKNRAARPFILHRKQVRWSIVCILLLLFILECCSIFASGRRTLHATQMEWTYSCQRVEGGLTLPAHLAIPEGETGTLSARLPSELTSDDMLCVYSNELLGRIQVDGADAASFGAEAHLSEPGGNFYFFPLDAEQAGKASELMRQFATAASQTRSLGSGLELWLRLWTGSGNTALSAPA